MNKTYNLNGRVQKVYQLLPHTDCGDCKKKGCLQFAISLAYREIDSSNCPHLSELELQELDVVLALTIPRLSFGQKNDSIPFGGEEVFYRHQFRMITPTLLLAQIDDDLDKKEVDKRLEIAAYYSLESLGEHLGLDGVAIRNTSGEASSFLDCVSRALKRNLPGLLICSSLQLIEEALKAHPDQRFIIYLEKNEEDMEDLVDLGGKFDCILVITGKESKDLSGRLNYLQKKGVTDFIIDVGDGKFVKTLKNTSSLRKRGLAGIDNLSHPLISPHISTGGSQEEQAYNQASQSCQLMAAGIDCLILEHLEPWCLLPPLKFRQNFFSDPRTKPSVSSGIYPIGTPNQDSPVLVTSNFTATYYSLIGDLEERGVSAYVLPVDTGGLAVSVAMAAAKMNAAQITAELERLKVGEKVSHRRLVLPGYSAPLAGDLETLSSWEVNVGPVDSSGLADYLKKK